MVSMIAPAYNNPDEVDLLLRSIAERCSGDFEVIVVDDGSRDRQLTEVCARYGFARCVRLSENGGAARARNEGARAARCDLLLFLDSDMVVQTDLTDVASRLFMDPAVVAAVGAMDPIPANPGYCQKFWALVKAFSLPQESHSSTFYPAIGAIRRAVFDDVGGFDQNIRGASVEDYEFSMRLVGRGWRVHYAPDLVVRVHYKGIGATLRQSFVRSTKWTLLFYGRRQFDNHTTTRLQALGALCGAATIAVMPLLLVDRRAAVGLALFGIAYLVVNGPFFRYVASTAGATFVPAAVGFHLLLSLTVTLGALRGLMYMPLGADRRRARLYR